MASLLVATKLHAPRRRADAVDRPLLIGRLRRGARSKLTLVSAPAGFGKTTVLAEFLAAAHESERTAAWLSLDQSDNEPLAFWAHVIAALQTAVPGLGATAAQALETGQGPVEPVLAALLNELGATSTDIDLVLDDYHVIDRREIHDAVAFLLDRLPPNIHVAIATRADPPLPLARLRGRGELVEIRAADLRFSAEEVAAYLNGPMGLNLDTREVATLARRTEGWIAALQLAALSIEGRGDAVGFIEAFAGNDRYIVDYLVEEVLDRQPDTIRRFLARTCFLDRLSGPLCDAVTADSGSQAMLEALDRANLFLVPFDPRREWYRYHHLFADVLRTHFAAELSAELAVLHQRASRWFTGQGERPGAIRHALAANDFVGAAALIEYAIPDLRRMRQEATMRTWIEALPDPLVRSRPVLGVALMGALLSSGIAEGAEGRLSDAESAISMLTAGATGDPLLGPVVVDRDQLPALPAAIELYRSALAQMRGDLPAAIEHAQRSIGLAPSDEHVGRASAAGFLAIASWTRGELGAAERWWTECRDGLRRANHIGDVMGPSVALADINLTMGRLRGATRVCEDALQLAGEQQGMVPRGTADVHASLGGLYLVSGDLEGAAQHLVRSEELGELAGTRAYPHRWRVAMASLREIEGDPESALDLLDEAERVYVSDFFPNTRPIGAMKARVLIRNGRLSEAERWQRTAGVAITDEPTYLHEFEHITLARLLLAQNALGAGTDTIEEGVALLDRLLEAAEHGGRIGSVLEISILLSLAHHARGDLDKALVPLTRALTLAEPEGYVRTFLDEGEPMAALLKVAAKRGPSAGFARALLSEFSPGDTPNKDSGQSSLIEPLSERELDVLRMLRSDLDGPEIARELGVSLNTMRTHTKSIYDKLGVNNRRAAVRRADELDLLRSGSPR